MERGTIRLIALVVVYIFYLSVGAAIFSSIEGPYEQRILSDLRKKRDEFLLKHPCVTEKELENFVKHVVAAQDMGIQPLRNESDKKSWGFGSSFFFAGTVATTIGKEGQILFNRWPAGIENPYQLVNGRSLKNVLKISLIQLFS